MTEIASNVNPEGCTGKRWRTAAHSGASAASATRRSRVRTLARLAAVTGPHHPVADLDCDHYAATMAHWDDAAAATWNRPLSALVSFTTWAQRQDLLAGSARG
ncbi:MULTISPECIES: hypothetical protein [unclassified Nonomuraea]|uniref:hypothetical protein n=1 Tax=unclassified Nonomuraea TaxID=2593643 RepID=UPI0033CADE2F